MRLLRSFVLGFALVGISMCGSPIVGRSHAQVSPPLATLEPSSIPTASLLPTTPLNLTVSPISLSLQTTPGVSTQRSIKIRNNSSEPENLSISLGSFTADASGSQPILLEGDPTQEFMSWLQLSETSFTVMPGEWKTIDLTFSPPESAGFSYYYALYIQRSQQGNEQFITTNVEGSVAVLVLTLVDSANARRELRLNSVKADHYLVEYLPQRFKLEVENAGNVHVAPVGNIFIDGQGQQDLAVISINAHGNSVLPQTKRTLEVIWDEGFPVRDPETNKLLWNFDQVKHFRIGKYTAHVVLVYDNGERDVPIESYVTFWVVPWKMLLAAVSIACFTGLGIVMSIRILWKKIRSVV